MSIELRIKKIFPKFFSKKTFYGDIYMASQFPYATNFCPCDLLLLARILVSCSKRIYKINACNEIPDKQKADIAQ